MDTPTPIGYKVYRFFLWLVLVIYMLVLSKMILFKSASPRTIKRHFQHNISWQRVKEHAKEGNYTLFTTIKLYLNARGRKENSIQNLAGNLIGFMPLGLLLPLLSRRLRSFWKMTLIAFLASLSFEVVQLLTLLGSFDVDDLLLNTLGGILGYLIFLLFYYAGYKRPVSPAAAR